jgi:two-component system, chemotaxis family, protein-glutamate methylesterase/glutaminase
MKAAAVVIGTSAGALDALSILLPLMPQGYPLPIIIVIHIPPDKKSVLTSILQAKCKLDVREAEDKEPIIPGTVYLAAPDYHLLIETDHRLSLSSDDPVLFSRPSIDVLFESAADAYKEGLVGVILTGGSDDGANGLKAIADAGGIALVQNPEQSFAPSMPRAAISRVPEAHVLNLEQIGSYLQKVAA